MAQPIVLKLSLMIEESLYFYTVISIFDFMNYYLLENSLNVRIASAE